MFIDANEIIKLIEAAKDCQERLPEDEQWLHFSDVEGFLQKLIDDEEARLNKMAEDYADEEYGRWEQENAAIEKELEIDFDWPHGV
jgi:hypothetical protein